MSGLLLILTLPLKPSCQSFESYLNFAHSNCAEGITIKKILLEFNSTKLRPEELSTWKRVFYMRPRLQFSGGLEKVKFAMSKKETILYHTRSLKTLWHLKAWHVNIFDFLSCVFINIAQNFLYLLAVYHNETTVYFDRIVNEWRCNPTSVKGYKKKSTWVGGGKR